MLLTDESSGTVCTPKVTRTMDASVDHASGLVSTADVPLGDRASKDFVLPHWFVRPGLTQHDTFRTECTFTRGCVSRRCWRRRSAR